MNYYIDCEFLEGTQKRRIGNIELPKYFDSKNTIDLISIGIVAENGREYYAISKDFNLKEAWNRYDLKDDNSVGVKIGCLPPQNKIFWIRENVLKHIYYDLCLKDEEPLNSKNNPLNFSYKTLKNLINKYGKSNKQIADEVYKFIFPEYNKEEKYLGKINMFNNNFVTNYWVKDTYLNPQLYGYYSDYDWVVFCWLFGRMIDLPKGFPMYCIDLKQDLDRKAKNKIIFQSFEEGLESLKTDERCPKQTNEHNALADTRWNKKLHEFLKNL